MRRDLRQFLVHLRRLVGEVSAITLDLAGEEMSRESQLALADRLTALGDELRAVARDSAPNMVDGHLINGHLGHSRTTPAAPTGTNPAPR